MEEITASAGTEFDYVARLAYQRTLNKKNNGAWFDFNGVRVMMINKGV